MTEPGAVHSPLYVIISFNFYNNSTSRWSCFPSFTDDTKDHT